MTDKYNMANVVVMLCVRVFVQVGFFPCECVELISDKSIPQSMEGIVSDLHTKPGTH